MRLILLPYILLCSLWLASGEASSLFQMARNPHEWQDPRLSTELLEGKVDSILPMSDYLKAQGKKVDFDNEVSLVILKSGLKAVFKPCAPETLKEAHAEVIAYKTSQLLGFPYVPPTVLRKIGGKTGSCQLFIETPYDPLDKGVLTKALAKINARDLQELALFYYIFGQWDFGPHNLLIYKRHQQYYLIAIDNSGIAHKSYMQYADFPFVKVAYSDQLETHDWDLAFPFEKVQVINHPTSQKLQITLKEAFPAIFYKNLKFYQSPFIYILYQNALWRQFPSPDKYFILAALKHPLQNSTIQALQRLTPETLQEIFVGSGESLEEDLKMIERALNRKNTALKYNNF